jgi:hypothetical protein
VSVSAREGVGKRLEARNEPTHPRASAQLLYCEIDGRLVHTCTAKCLDDLPLPKERRKDSAMVGWHAQHDHERGAVGRFDGGGIVGEGERERARLRVREHDV